MIQLDDITLTFPDGDRSITAIDHATLTVERGTVTGITGPSGSGKSSLLAVATTLIRPDSGSVLIDGTAVTTLAPSEAAELRRSRLGIVFQQANLLPSLTAREQLLVMNELTPRSSRRRRAEVVAEADELLDAVGLADHAAKHPHQLSGGQRQRVNIARALVGGPAVLAVDEPTSALDQHSGAEIIDLIVRLTREHDTATLLVTHDLSHLDRLDASCTMVDGALTMQAGQNRSDAFTTVS